MNWKEAIEHFYSVRFEWANRAGVAWLFFLPGWSVALPEPLADCHRRLNDDERTPELYEKVMSLRAEDLIGKSFYWRTPSGQFMTKKEYLSSFQ